MNKFNKLIGIIILTISMGASANAQFYRDGGILGGREFTVVDTLIYIGSGDGIAVQKMNMQLDEFIDGVNLGIASLGERIFRGNSITSVSDTLGGYVYYTGNNGFVAKLEVSGSTLYDESRNRIIYDFDYQLLQFPENTNLTDIEIYNGRLIISGQNGLIYTSDDFGETWFRVASGTSRDLTNIEIFGDKIFITGKIGTVLISLDSGDSFVTTNVQSDRDINDIDFKSNGEEGFLVGNNFALLYTDDGGLNWHTFFTSGGTIDLFTIDFRDDQVGLIGGEDGYLIKTTDSGETWFTSGHPYGEMNFKGIHHINNSYTLFLTDSRAYRFNNSQDAANAIKRLMADTFELLHDPTGAGLLVTADWATASWGNYGMRELGTEPRIAFPNDESWPYHINYSGYWDQAYTIIFTIDALNETILYDADYERQTESNLYLNFLKGIIYGQLGLKYDQAIVLQNGEGLQKSTQNFNPRSFFTPTNTFKDKRSFEFDSNSNARLAPSIVFKSGSLDIKSKMTSEVFVPYDQVINVALNHLDGAMNDLINLFGFNFDGIFFNGEIDQATFEQLINSLRLELMVLKARTSEENENIDWSSVLNYSSNTLTSDFTILADDINWLSNLMWPIAYPGWGRVDQKIVHLLDPSQPESWPLDGTEPPLAESLDARFDLYFENAGPNNFRSERGLYFFSQYRLSRYDEYLSTWTTEMPFMYVASTDLIRAEALIRTEGDRDEAAALVNKYRTDIGGLEALTGENTDQEFLDAIYYEWMIEVGPFGNGPLAFYNIRRFDELQEGTITQLPVPANVLKENGMEVYTFGGVDIDVTDDGITIHQPTNLETGVVLEPQIIWANYSDVNNYSLSISENGTEIYFISSLADTTFDLSTSGFVLDEYTNYDLSIFGYDGSESLIRESDNVNFRTVDTLMNSPSLFAPMNEDDNVLNRAAFHWEIDRGNSQSDWRNFEHNLQLSHSSDFETGTIIDTMFTGLSSWTWPSQTFMLDGLEDLTQYFWRVASVNEGGSSDWSEVFTFTTTTDVVEGELSLLYPDNGQEDVEIPITFTWNEQNGAIAYDVQISTSIDFEKSVTLNSITNTSAFIEELVPQRVYYWRAKAKFEGSEGEWTPTNMFTTKEPIPDAPTWEPENGEEVIGESVNFSWGESDYADTYNIQISEDDNFGNILSEQADISENNITFSGFESGTYYWRVSASNQSGTSDWSEVRNFSVLATNSEYESEFPTSLVLDQNYPNPFNPSTNIRFGVPEASEVRLEVFNLLGQSIAVLVNDNLKAGYHTVTFDASRLSSGIYIYRIVAGSSIQTRKLTLLK